MSPKRAMLALACTLVVLASIAFPATGAPTKYFTSSISPACVGADTSTTFALTLTNANPPGGQSFGSANVSIPTGFGGVTLVDPSITFVPASSSKSWTATVNGSIIELRSGKTSSNGVFPGESVVVHFSATTPATAGSYPWNVLVKQSNDFRGTNNDFFLLPDTAPATSVVAGSCAPAAANDSYSIDEDAVLTVSAPGVLGNDTDPAGVSLTAVLVGSGPSQAAAFTLGADGSFSYTPNPNYNGGDSFTYKANNGTDDSNVATVSITVSAVNDAPSATAQSVTTNEDTAKPITLSGTDVDGDLLSFTITSLPSNGTLYEGSGTGGTQIGTVPFSLSGTAVTYDPNPDYNGSDGFDFKANDGTTDSAAATVSIGVTTVPDAPDAVDDSTSIILPGTLNGFDVVANDTDPDTPNASLTISAADTTSANGGTVSCLVGGRTCDYSPPADFAGSDTFQYTVTDGGGTDTATVSVFVANGVLDCDQNDTAEVTGLGDLADVHITRLANTDPEATCVAKNYVLTTQVEDPPGADGPTNVVTFDQQPIPGQESAHYLMVITWTYPPGTSTSSNPSTVGGRTFQIDYGDGTGPHDAELCDSVTYDGQGNVTGATHPAGIPWCITGQSYTIDGSGDIVLVQSWDGLGDPKVW